MRGRVWRRGDWVCADRRRDICGRRSCCVEEDAGVMELGELLGEIRLAGLVVRCCAGVGVVTRFH